MASDYRKAYENIIPYEKHLQTKAETFTVEGYKQFIQTFFGKNEEKVKMLLQENGNVENIYTSIDASQK